MTFRSHLAFGTHLSHLCVVIFVPNQGCDIFLRSTSPSWDNDLEQDRVMGAGSSMLKVRTVSPSPHLMTDCRGKTPAPHACSSAEHFLTSSLADSSMLLQVTGDSLAWRKGRLIFQYYCWGGDSLCCRGSVVPTQLVVEPVQLLKCSMTNP